MQQPSKKQVRTQCAAISKPFWYSLEINAHFETELVIPSKGGEAERTQLLWKETPVVSSDFMAPSN